MKTWIKVVLGGVAGATLVAGGVAFAQSRMGHEWGYGPQRGYGQPWGGPMGMGPMGPMGMGPHGGMGPRGGWGPMMGGWGQGDGPRFGGGRMIERAFARLDADKDGTVTVQEAMALPDARFADLDANKDGFVDKAEVDAHIAKVRAEAIDRMVGRFDIDGDGKISKDEAEKPFRKRFALFDRNDDGKVTKDEALDAMPMAGHGFGRHGWGWGERGDRR